jgi:hypothetical protein
MPKTYFSKRRPIDHVASSHAVRVVPPSIIKMASDPGWIDHEIVKVRRLARLGASYAAIADAMGWTVSKAYSYCRRNSVHVDRQHSASSKASQAKQGKGLWIPRAEELWAAGMRNAKQISIVLGVPYGTVAAWRNRINEGL